MVLLKLFIIDTKCNGTVVGRVTNNKLNELSGFVESHRFPGIFYAIEDSGNEPVVYIMNQNGSIKGDISILCHIKTIPWFFYFDLFIYQ